MLCVPSRRAANGDAEGLPTVIPEAGAQGLPVVGTRHSGIPEAIGDESGGLLVDEGDVEGLARALTAVLTDDELWRRLSAGARDNVARHFDPRRQAAGARGDLRRGARPRHQQVIPAQALLAVPPLPRERQPLRRRRSGVDQRRGARCRWRWRAEEKCSAIVVHAPESACSSTTSRPASLAEVAQPVRRVAEEVARLLVQRPAERRGGDQMAAGPQQPAALRERVAGALEVLEHLGQQDRVRGSRRRAGRA